MSEEKVFYKMRLMPVEEGLAVVTDRLYSIHETPCFYMCVGEWTRHHLKITDGCRDEGETVYQYAKRKGMKIRRIDKISSRIAFETEGQALHHLKFLKRKQVQHLRRELAFVEAFIDADPSLESMGLLDSARLIRREVPGTYDLVHEYLRFE